MHRSLRRRPGHRTGTVFGCVGGLRNVVRISTAFDVRQVLYRRCSVLVQKKHRLHRTLVLLGLKLAINLK